MRIFHLVEAESLWALSQRGSVNLPQVRELQDRLRAAGFDPGPSDGWYGQRTADAVRAYQQANNLAVDGDAGPQTLGRLGMAGAQTTSPTPTPPAETPPAPAPRQPAREPADEPAREPSSTQRTDRRPEPTPEPTRREPEPTPANEPNNTATDRLVPPEEESNFNARQSSGGFYTSVDPRFIRDPFGSLDDEGDWTPVPNNTAKARVIAAKRVDQNHFAIFSHSIWGVRELTAGRYAGQYTRATPENAFGVKVFNNNGEEIAVTNRNYNDTDFRSVENYYNRGNFELGNNLGRRDEFAQVYFRLGRQALSSSTTPEPDPETSEPGTATPRDFQYPDQYDPDEEVNYNEALRTLSMSSPDQLLQTIGRFRLGGADYGVGMVRGYPRNDDAVVYLGVRAGPSGTSYSIYAFSIEYNLGYQVQGRGDFTDASEAVNAFRSQSLRLGSTYPLTSGSSQQRRREQIMQALNRLGRIQNARERARASNESIIRISKLAGL